MDSKKFQAILKDYKILSKVGEGTYGEVFKAVSLKTEEGELPQLVALKKHNVLPGEEGVSYCTLQELKYLNAVQGCTNVLQLQETFLVDEQRNNKNIKSMVMVTPYYSNDLTGAMKQLKELPHIKCVFKQILQGLEQIHARGFMHRDIKAANILLNEGQVVIGDLGMMTSFIREQPTNFPSNVITLWYRPPELLMGNERYGAEVDMWSVGCVFVELLTGLALFPGRDEREQLDLIFQRLGHPAKTVSEWIDASSLDSHNVEKWTNYLKSAQYPQHSSLRSLLQRAVNNCSMSSSNLSMAADLVERLLTSPQKRLTASQALQHPFFSQNPAPCLPEQIPRLTSSHEYELKMERHREFSSSSSSNNAPTSNNNSSSSSSSNTLENITKGNYQQQQQQPTTAALSQQQQQQRCGIAARTVSHAQRASVSPYQRPQHNHHHHHNNNNSGNHRSHGDSPSTSHSSQQPYRNYYNNNNNNNTSMNHHRANNHHNNNTNNNTNNAITSTTTGSNHLTHSTLRQQSVVQ